MDVCSSSARAFLANVSRYKENDHSYWNVVLMGGSDRSIQVFDMNKGAVAAVLPDAHSRAVHCISHNKGSVFTTQAPELYNLFLTSAVTDGVKIWDLRTLRCTRRYENHVNRVHLCSAAISACGRFIATGSEDNCVSRMAFPSERSRTRFSSHTAVISAPVMIVRFNPYAPFYDISSLLFICLSFPPVYVHFRSGGTLHSCCWLQSSVEYSALNSRASLWGCDKDSAEIGKKRTVGS
uniref:Uncharacterized protein n=1 Tax=Takifugu rubripes TaxID=31033 RepID=H2UY29_TAKRU